MGGMIILIVLLTSIGSNNDVYPSRNNLFLVAPVVFWQTAVFLMKKINKNDIGTLNKLLKKGYSNSDINGSNQDVMNFFTRVMDTANIKCQSLRKEYSRT